MFNFIYDFTGVVERFGQIPEQVSHFLLRLEIKLIIRKTKAIAFPTLFVGSYWGALHVAGIYAKQNVVRICILLIHIMRIVGADNLYIIFLSELQKDVVHRLLVVNLMALELNVII